MDRAQKEIQLLGFFGIYKEALNITTSYRKIFSQITLSVILPISLIYLAQIQISDLLLGKISPSEKSELATYLLLNIAFVICFLILSLISTSAVVYTIACIYTAREISFKTVMKVVPKVWKRLMITFIWQFIIFFAFIMGAVVLVVILWAVTLGSTPSAIEITFAIILLVIYLLVILYTIFVWQLANVISVLEDLCGIQALRKSKNLIKGNTRICTAIFLTNYLCFLVIDQGFKASVAGGDSVWGKLLHACLWSMLILFALVIQTIIYFICKSYHREYIDKSSLANHLEVYHKNYALLDFKDAQLQHSEV